MLIELGRYVAPEAIVNLTVPGLRISLANGTGSEATLKIMGSGKFETPVTQGPETKEYVLQPSGRSSVEGQTRIWSWTANYYWEPPQLRLALRKAELTLARISKASYRFELGVAGVAVQYILDTETTALLEEAYRFSLA